MSLFAGPEEHADNPPDTWRAVKVAERVWQLQTKDGGNLQSFTTKTSAEAAKQDGFYVRLYRDEARWYAGEKVENWKPYERSSK